jgi:hypothetical protein
LTSEVKRYWNIPPDEALKENSGNYAIPNQDISLIRIKQKDESGLRDVFGDKVRT